MAGKASVIAVSNQKGGVGKTTTTINLAKNLADRGKRTLLIDNDPQANATMALFGDDDEQPAEILQVFENGVIRPGPANAYGLYSEEPKVVPFAYSENLHVIGASKHLAEMSLQPMDILWDFRDAVRVFVDSYDFILIDCLPSFGTLQNASHAAADWLLIPTVLDEFSLKGIRELLETVDKKAMKTLNPELQLLGILQNRVSSKKVNVEEHYFSQLNDVFNGKIFTTKITNSTKIAESHALRKSMGEYMKNSVQAKQYEALTDEVLARAGE